MKIITDYFKLTDRQAEQFAQLDALYRDWNSKINVISRKDIDNLYEHHVLHSLAIAKWIPFQPDTTILDVGTGGGFPGIPLAIMFPQCQFVLVDSIGKKIKVASEVAKALGLTNVVCKQERVEEEKEKLLQSIRQTELLLFKQCSSEKLHQQKLSSQKLSKFNEKCRKLWHFLMDVCIGLYNNELL